jgi:hypothetical protein
MAVQACWTSKVNERVPDPCWVISNLVLDW